MSDVLVMAISLTITIFIMVIVYENKLIKKNKELYKANLLSLKISQSWDKLVFNHNILIDILEEHFTRDEINDMYIEKENKIKNELIDDEPKL